MVWSYDLVASNRSFLSSLDPEFFLVIARKFEACESSREQQLAAMHIRMLRDQSAEMLFSFLAAAIQSPRGVVLWIAKYRNYQLDDIVRQVSSGAVIRTVRGPFKATWESVAAEVCRFIDDLSLRDRVVNQYSKFWATLAREFVDAGAREEYNALKHGYRVGAGGSSIAIRQEQVPGMADPDGKVVTLSGSGFGSNFWVPKPIEGRPQQFSLQQKSRNWTPRSLLLQLEIIALSVRIIIAYLRLCNGENVARFDLLPPSESIFSDCWRNDGSLLASSFGDRIDPAIIPDVVEADMWAKCDTPLSSERGETTG